MSEFDNVAHIPPQYRDLVELIGEEATWKLCREYGGDTVYIPKGDRVSARGRAYLPMQYHRLVEVIGEEATRKLCRAHGKDEIYIPKLDHMLTQERARNIIEEWNGYNTGKLAKKYNLTRRMVQILVQGKRPPEVKGQMSIQEYLHLQTQIRRNASSAK